MLSVKKIKKISHLSFSTKKFLQFYNWKNCYPSKSIKLNKALSQSKVAIVSSAGLVIKDEQEPFNQNIKMGDTSFRVIPSSITPNRLEEHHRSDTFDHSGIQSNPFTGMPINHLLSLEKKNFVGSVSNKHISLMGSIINPSNLINDTIPKIISIFKNENIDIAIFIPV